MNLGKYNWLHNEGAPKMIVAALAEYGTAEIPGKESNSKIMRWAKELGLSNVYSNDDIPWCGLFIAYVVKQSGREPVDSPLWARSWAKWGVEAETAMLGDILVFQRGSGGHVGLYVGESANTYHVLGGNQSNKVNVSMIDKSRCIAIRRPEYKNRPKNVRRIRIDPIGNISTDEA